jgi:hypothetical protein
MRLGVEVLNFSLAKGQTISHITIHYGVTGWMCQVNLATRQRPFPAT